MRASGFEIVSLDEAHFRLIEGDYGKPFVCFTFDDGYRDNLEYAYPIFKRHNLPFAIYVPTDYADGHGDLWWLALEKVIVKVDALSVKIDGVAAAAALRHAGREGCRLPRRLLVAAGASTRSTRAPSCASCATASTSIPTALCTDLMMNWDEIRQLAADPLVTIGAHTRRHYALAKLTLAEAHAEIEESVRRIERETRQALPALQLSLRRRGSAGPREFDDRQGAGPEDRRDDAQGPHPSPARARAHRAAAGVAQRRLPEAALRQGAAERRAVRASSTWCRNLERRLARVLIRHYAAQCPMWPAISARFAIKPVRTLGSAILV